MGPRTRAPRYLLRIALRNCYAVAPLRLLPKSSLCAIRSLLRDMCANKSPSRDLCAVPSVHFHLKIRIPTEMYLRVFPAAQVLGNNSACLRRALEPFKQRWEPLAFRFQTQELFPWTIVRLLVLADVDDGEYHP